MPLLSISVSLDFRLLLLASRLILNANEAAKYPYAVTVTCNQLSCATPTNILQTFTQLLRVVAIMEGRGGMWCEI